MPFFNGNRISCIGEQPRFVGNPLGGGYWQGGRGCRGGRLPPAWSFARAALDTRSKAFRCELRESFERGKMTPWKQIQRHRGRHKILRSAHFRNAIHFTNAGCASRKRRYAMVQRENMSETKRSWEWLEKRFPSPENSCTKKAPLARGFFLNYNCNSIR